MIFGFWFLKFLLYQLFIKAFDQINIEELEEKSELQRMYVQFFEECCYSKFDKGRKTFIKI